jgi:surfeit locus 1 family protein
VTPARSPRFWLITLAALVTVGITLRLGAWQLDRAGQKLALQAAIEQRQAMPPIPQESLLGAKAHGELLHRQVVLRGSWLAQHTLFLDNRQMQGRQGFYVVTPLKLEGVATAVLVERGWVPRNFEQRERLPPIQTAEGLIELRGRIAPPPAKLYEFPGAQRGAIRQNLDLAQFRAETGLPLLDLAVRQTEGPPDGLLRDWPEAASGAATNYGYAFQWWAMSGLVAILYVWFQFIVPRRRVPHA